MRKSTEYPRSIDYDINHNPQYDGNVDPQYYQERAIRAGGNAIARQLGNIMSKYLPTSEKPHVLDIAAGSGIITRHLDSLGYNMEAVDLSEDMLTYLHVQNPIIPLALGDMNKTLPYPDSSFDGIVTSWANRFITNIDHFASETYRLLKPDGYFFWPIAPTESRIWAQKLKKKGFVRQKELISSLQDVGFGEVDIKRIPYGIPNRMVRQSSYPLYCIVAKK